MNRKTHPPGALSRLLSDPQIRRAEVDGERWYALPDLLTVLAETRYPEELWEDLRARDPQLGSLVEDVAFPAGRDAPAMRLDAVDLTGVLRLVQSLTTPRAQRIRRWLAASAAQSLREAEDPERAILRTRRSYARQGHSRRWIDKRLGSVSSRHDLTGEWYRRGAKASDDFRALTNELMTHAFGADVLHLREQKGLQRTREGLRDHMSDLELSLTALGEHVAAALHRRRDSQGMDALLRDARDAGVIIAETRRAIGRELERADQPAAASAGAAGKAA